MRLAVIQPGRKLLPYRKSLAGTLLAAREAVMGPIRPMLRDADVTEQQWRVLRVLDNAGPMEPTALSEAALLYPPSVARILRDLVERGLVSRSAHPTDRRRAVLSLSPAGAAQWRGWTTTPLALDAPGSSGWWLSSRR